MTPNAKLRVADRMIGVHCDPLPDSSSPLSDLPNGTLTVLTEDAKRLESEERLTLFLPGFELEIMLPAAPIATRPHCKYPFTIACARNSEAATAGYLHASARRA